MTVVAALELHNEISSGRRAREPHRRHRRLSATVHEAHHLEARHPALNFFGEVDLGLTRCAVRPPALGRVSHRVEHGWVGVTENQRTPGADVVDIAAALDVGDARTFGMGDKKRRPADCPERPYG